MPARCEVNLFTFNTAIALIILTGKKTRGRNDTRLPLFHAVMHCYPFRSTTFEVPYTFNIHESPVTCTQFYSECPKDFIKALSSTASGRSKKRQLLRENSTPQVWSTKHTVFLLQSVINFADKNSRNRFTDTCLIQTPT